MASLLAEQLVTQQHQSVHGLEPEHQTVRQQGKSEVGKMLCDQLIVSVDSSAVVMSDGDTVMKVDELGDTGVCAAERWPAGELELGTEIQYFEQTEHVVLFACLLPSHRYHAH